MVSCCVVSGHSQCVELEFLATQRQFRRNCWVGKAQAGDCERGNSASLKTCQRTVVPQPVLFIFNRWTQSAYCELRSFTIWLMMHFWLCLCLWLKRYVNYQIVSLHLYQHLPALNFLLLLCGDYSLYVVFTELALERSALLQFLLTLGFIDLFFCSDIPWLLLKVLCLLLQLQLNSSLSSLSVVLLACFQPSSSGELRILWLF